MPGLTVRERPTAARQPEVRIDPRILARLVAVRRDQRRRHWRVLTVAVAVATALVGAWLAVRSPLLAVRRIKVFGADHTTPSEVLAASGLDRPRPMLDIDGGEIARRVMALPWVAQVAVHRRWPTTVTITIGERVPRAQVNGPAGQAAVVDGEGRVLATGGVAAQLLASQSPALPHLLGVGAAGAAGTTLARGATPALELLQALAASPIAANVVLTAVMESDDGTLSATVSPGQVVVVFGSTDQLTDKVIAARTLLAQLRPGTSATIDVQVVDDPVLTSGKNGTMVSTTQRG